MAVRVAAATDKAPLHNGKPSRIRTLKPPQRHWRGYTRGVQHLRHYATDHCRNTAGFAPPSSPLCPRKFTARTRLGAFLFLFVYFVYFVFYLIFISFFCPAAWRDSQGSTVLTPASSIGVPPTPWSPGEEHLLRERGKTHVSLRGVNASPPLTRCYQK